MKTMTMNQAMVVNERGKQMSKKHVPGEIRLIAFTSNDDGTTSVYDIVETSFHYASRWYSKFVRDNKVCAIECGPIGLNSSYRRVWIRGPEANRKGNDHENHD